jgi:hypothetical protein
MHQGGVAMPVEIQGPVHTVNVLFVIVPILVVFFSICSLFWPRMMWFLAEGWKFKDAQPSGCYLVATRISGVVLLILGTVSCVILWSIVHAH